jgi:hypothetical protein
VFNDYEEDLKLVINIVMQITQIILLMLRVGMWKLLKTKWMKLYWFCYKCDDGIVFNRGCDFDYWILNYVF